MIRAFYSGSSGLHSRQNAVDITANNIANSETTGFKQKTEKFNDMLYSSMVDLGINSVNTNRLTVGNGAFISQAQSDMTCGVYIETGLYTHFGIEGEGFFAVRDTSGNTFYTRDGSFRLVIDNNVYYLEDLSGKKVLDKNKNPIEINNGVLSTEPAVFGFANSAGLQSSGENNYIQTQLSGAPQALNNPLKQGFLEGSNVDMIRQMSHLLISERAYQMNSRVVQTADQIEQMSNQLR